MISRITAADFSAAEDVQDWRVVVGEACTRFATGSFEVGLELVTEIGRLAKVADHHPDVELSYSSVVVRVHTHAINGLSQRDIDLAREISAAARRRGIAADPGSVQTIEVGIDAMSIAAVLPFWRAVMGYAESAERELAHPLHQGPRIWFQQMDAPRPSRNRIHLDVCVPHDQAEARISAAVAAGGTIVSDASAPHWWVLADPEGNEACISTWLGRDE